MRVADKAVERAVPRARAYKMLVMAALLVPALLFAAVAWQDRRGGLREAAEDAAQAAAILQQHALSVLEAHGLVAGRADDVILAAIDPGYFTGFWRSVGQSRDAVAGLVREDGTILARNPSLPPDVVAPFPDAPMAQAVRKAHEGVFRARSSIDGVERFYAFRKLAGYPVFVVYGTDASAALRRWQGDLVAYGGFFGVAALALVLTVLSTLRRTREEEAAVQQWREAALRADAEAERRIAAEQRLHQAQKMETLGQLTGGVVHDFNNLLAVIIANLEMLRGRQNSRRDEKRVDNALAAAECGAKAVRSLLAFARRQPLHTEAFDVNAALRGMEDLLRQSIGKRVALCMDLAPDAWPVEADASQTVLAVLNLAVNARDAMPDGGTLWLRTWNTTLREDAQGPDREFVVLAVADTGTGMPPEVVRRGFEPFFTTKEPGKGTGLGLSQVYGFAEQSRGRVTIRSEVGRGTTVTLYLPRAAAAGRFQPAGVGGAVPAVPAGIPAAKPLQADCDMDALLVEMA
jgi:signal transduction histidine kinase